MSYLRSLFLNFLVVFFVDRVSPGLQIINFEQVPDVGADLIFSILVGFFNATVLPVLIILELKPTLMKLGILTFIISYAAFIIISIVPFGIQVTNPLGVFVGGTIVWLVAFFTNHLEFQHYSRMNKS